MPKLGGTDDFPRGKLSAGDEGGLAIAVGVKDGTIIVDFGKPVVWIGMDKQSALQFADAIRRTAEQLPDA